MKPTEHHSLAFGIMSTFAVTCAHAQVLFNHAGASDPASEGWTHQQGGSGTAVGPIINDLGTGLDAWSVSSSSSTGISFYRQTLTTAQIQQANQLGWSLSANLRITTIPDL